MRRRLTNVVLSLCGDSVDQKKNVEGKLGRASISVDLIDLT